MDRLPILVSYIFGRQNSDESSEPLVTGTVDPTLERWRSPVLVGARPLIVCQRGQGQMSIYMELPQPNLVPSKIHFIEFDNEMSLQGIRSMSSILSDTSLSS